MPKSPKFVETGSDDCNTKHGVEQKPAVKQPQKVPTSPEFIVTDSDDADTEDDEEKNPTVKKVSKSPGPVRMKSDVSNHDKLMVKRIETLSKKATPGKEPVLPVVKQSPELIETDPCDSLRLP